MKNILILGIFFAFFCCKPEEETITNEWNLVYHNPFLYPFDLFLFGDTGIMLGRITTEDTMYSVLVKTVDNGRNWTEINYPQNFPEISGFACIYAINSKMIFGAGLTSLYRSDNGGITWNYVSKLLPEGGAGISLYFENSLEGFFTASTLIYKTGDGGLNWLRASNKDIMIYARNFQFPSQAIGFAAGGSIGDYYNSGYILKTVDGGNHWTNLNIEAGCITSLSFIDSLNGFAFTFDGELLKTGNGGKFWITVNSNLDEVNYAESIFKSLSEGYYCNRNHIWSTINGGKAWKNEFEGNMDSVNFAGIRYADPDHIFAYSVNGTIYKRKNSGL